LLEIKYCYKDLKCFVKLLKMNFMKQFYEIKIKIDLAAVDDCIVAKAK